MPGTTSSASDCCPAISTETVVSAPHDPHGQRRDPRLHREGTIDAPHAAHAAHQGLLNLAEDDKIEAWGRFGWIGKGWFYLVIGGLVATLGLGMNVREANRGGALEMVARQPAGRWALAALAIGLALYVVWRAMSVLRPDGADGALERLGYFLSAAFYATLAFTAAEMVLAGSNSAPQSSVNGLVNGLLGTTWGQLVVGGLGLVAAGVGVYFVKKGLNERYMKDLDTAHWSSAYLAWVRRTGTVGWIGRSFVLFLLAAFLTHAAVTRESGAAPDLDRMLAEVTGTWWGTALVIAGGVGLMAYGAFALLTWRRRTLHAT